MDSFLLVDCLFHILPDGSFFIRGDSNGDLRIDISDAVTTLGHLFLGTEDLYCPDAADANDDGTIDISDPVATLEFLFSGAGELPPPNGIPGNDPTADSLQCFFPR